MTQMKYIFLILVIFATNLFSKTYQIHLKPSTWQLIGVNGYHIPNPNAVPVVGWTQLLDTNDSDDNVTWDMLDENVSNSTTTPDSGNRIYSTLGLFIQRGENDDLYQATINYKKKTLNRTLPFLSMYVSSSGESRRANFKIYFQSDYEGQVFYINFNGSTTQSFEGIFDSKKTRDNPLSLLKYKADSNSAVKKITKVIDMNLTDNNISYLDNIDVNNQTIYADGIGGRQQMGVDDNLSVYKWNASYPWNTGDINQTWNIYLSGNDPAYNDFTDFTAGQAYWVKLDTNSKEPAGLLLGTGDINSTTHALDEGAAQAKWNLLSFNDSYLRYITSGVFIKNSDYNGSGFVIRDNFRSQDIVIPAHLSDSDINVSAYINNLMNIGDLNGSFAVNIRSYPAVDSGGNSGVVLIGDEDFEINASSTNFTTMSLAGNELRDRIGTVDIRGVSEQQQMYETRIDEYVLAITPNPELFNNSGGLIDKKTRLLITIPAGAGNIEIDLSNASTVLDVLSAIGAKFITVGTNYSKAISIDLDLDGTHDTIILSSGERFYVRDQSFVKLYDFNDSFSSADFALTTDGANSLISSDGTLSDTVSKINLVNSGSDISAYIVNQDKKRIMLLSGSDRYYFLKEKGVMEQLTRVELSNETNISIRGGISYASFGFELARTRIKELNISALGNSWSLTQNTIQSSDNNVGIANEAVAVVDDLTYAPVWSPDFPIDGPLYSVKDLRSNATMAEAIMSGVNRSDGTIYWRQADATMDLNLWKNEQERFNLFKVHKERGYWVYVREGVSVVTNPITFDNYNFSTLITRTFDNPHDSNISHIESNESVIVNNIDLTVDVDISGFDGISTAPGSMPENVRLNIDGEIVPMIKNGAAFSYLTRFNDNEVSGIKERIYPERSSGMNMIAADGKGNFKNQIISFDNVKPKAPIYYFETNSTVSGGVPISFNGGFNFSFDNNVTLRIFDGNLTDFGSNDSKLIKDEESITLPAGYSSVTHHVNPLAGSYISYGTPAKPVYDLRISISYDSNDLWSNMRRVYYAPVYKSTHILQHSENAPDTNDSTPYAFSSDGQSAAKYTEGGSWTNSGVEISTYDGNYSDTNITLALAYEPIIGAKFDSALATEVYFDDNTSQNGFIGRIRFSPVYAGDVFYIYSSERNATYYQVFPAVSAPSTNPLELILIDSNQSFSKP